jgi:polysaccharide biosynthesis protein PslH
MPDRRRVLLLAPFPPRLDAAHGGGRAVAQLVRALARRQRVALAWLRTRDEAGIDPELAKLCERVLEHVRPGVSYSSVRPWPRALTVLPRMLTGRPLWVAARWQPAFARALRRLAEDWQPHVVQAEFGAMGQYLDAAAEGSTGALRIVTIHEPAAANAARRRDGSSGAERLAWTLSARLWSRYEGRLLQRADATVVFTAADRRALHACHATAPIAQIPLGSELPALPADPVGEQPPALLFVGNYVHPPNLEAARWLLDELFPRLRTRFPGLRLWIVGDGAPDSLRRAAGDGVQVTGRVPEVAPFMERAAVVVAPLRSGGGMRVKMLDAMAAGKAVVATPLAVEGLDVRHGEQLLVAGDADAFVAAVASLLDDAGRRRELAQAARAWAESNLSWEQCAMQYEALYDRLQAEDRADNTAPVSV